MTPLRLFAIICIFFCTMIGWFILGASINVRTSEKSLDLGERMESNWGGRHIQIAPQFYYVEMAPTVVKETTTNALGSAITVQKEVLSPQRRYLECQQTDIHTDLAVDYRQKGLLWYSIFQVGFEGRYQIVNTSGREMEVFSKFLFPSPNSIYDDFKFQAGAVSLLEQAGARADNAGEPQAGEWTGKVTLAPGERVEFLMAYRSQGRDLWQYDFGENTKRVKNFTLTAATQFKEFNIPDNCISPGERTETDKGWQMVWKYANNVSKIRIGIDMPKKLNPGPTAERISFFAPVSLLFFFTILIIVGGVRRISIHPMNYFFLSAAFFSFHLLFAYLVDHWPLEVSFFVSAAVSVLLVFTYMRLVVDGNFAWRVTLPTQVIYLILFSYSFFFEGFTGLTVTIGSIVTLFVLMQMTAKVNWAEVFEAAKNKAS